MGLAILMTALFVTGCNPRQLPGFRQLAQRLADRNARQTEEAIKKSPALQELNHLCTEELPKPAGFVLVEKSTAFKEPTFLSYNYQSKLDYHTVKTFYLTYFAEHGWQLTKQKDGGWGPSMIEVRNDNYEVAIGEAESRGDGSDFFMACTRL